jgi:hypothetical protein
MDTLETPLKEESNYYPPQTDYVTLRIEPELRKLVEEIAAQEKRSMSQMTRILIREAVATRKQGARKTRKIIKG